MSTVSGDITAFSRPFFEDIEHLIFKTAAESDLQLAYQLATISPKVQKWVEPILYTTIPYRKTVAFLRSLKKTSKPRSFYEQHVKIMCLSSQIDGEEIAKILSYCRGLKKFACWVDWGDFLSQSLFQENSMSELRPQRLSIRLPSNQPDFGLPLFQNITHFDVCNEWETWTTWHHFESLPNLSHLALDLQCHRRSDVPVIIESVRHILSECDNLRVCLFHPCAEEASQNWSTAENTLEPIDDPRIVILEESYPIDNWEAHLRGRSDKWDEAERLVRLKVCPKVILAHL